MIRSFSKPKLWYVVYNIECPTKLPYSFLTSSDALDFIFAYQGTLDKTNMTIVPSHRLEDNIETMSEQDFLSTVKHPTQRTFSKKAVYLIKKKNLVYNKE